MFPRLFSITRCMTVAALVAPVLLTAPSEASQRDKAFFKRVSGNWQGPGEIVAGKYKGTKFVCKLSGDALSAKGVGLKLDGNCRVGVFSQPMSATITKNGSTYTGKFLAGANGKGLDIRSGAVSGDKVVMTINRQKLNGAMIARLVDEKTMNITISVKVEDRMIPVIGMSLNRKTDALAVGSIE